MTTSKSAAQVASAEVELDIRTLIRMPTDFLVLVPTKSVAPVKVQRRDSTFLRLVPDASDTFPQFAPQSTAPVSAAITPLSNSSEKMLSSPTTTSPLSRPLATVTIPESVSSVEDIEERHLSARRSSSVSSTGPRRYLKLGPVHFGGEPGVPDYTWSE